MFKWLTGGGDDNEFRRGPKKGQPEPKAGLGKYEKTATGVRFKLTMDGSPIKPTKHIPAKTTLSVPAKRQTAKMKDGSYKSIESAGKLISNTSPPNPVTASFGHAFVGAVLEAYSGHHTLKIRPDDVWLTLMVSFAKFIDAKPEQLRKCFVEHEGKKELVIVAPGNFYTLDWPSISRKFSDLIAKNTKDSVREWVEPDFSTTTAHDRFVGGVLLMGAMKNYFSYGLRTMCGIPCVEMEGTLEDWTKLRLKIDRFKKYGEDAKSPELVKWHRILVPIFDEFVQSFKGEINPDFWQQCRDWSTFGSGASTYVSGWVNAFVPFDDKGCWSLRDPEEIIRTGKYGSQDHETFRPFASIDVPIKIDDNGVMHDACLLVGGIVNNFDESSNTISPSFDVLFYEMPVNEYADDIAEFLN